MAIVIVPYTADHVLAVKEFNQRLLDGGAPDAVLFAEEPTPDRPTRLNPRTFYSELFLAVENDKVRGGYILKHQIFSFDGARTQWVAYYHHAVSEGIINKSYARVGALLIRDAIRRQPLVYALGMGGYDSPLPKMLKLLGWSHCLVPFYFKVVQPGRFLRNTEQLRRTKLRQLLTSLATVSGAGSIAIKAVQKLKQWHAPGMGPFTVEHPQEFGAWINPLWEQAKSAYAMTAVRDSDALQALYPLSYRHLTPLRVSKDEVPIGWAVVGQRRKNPLFGDMHVGSIVDCFASPQNALPVIRAATQLLEARGLDLIVSNQSHIEWCRALRNSGFFEGPSNFILATSKRLAELLTPFEEKKNLIHFNRADGDGLPQNF